VTPLRTSSEIRRLFRDEGVTLSDWARRHGFSRLSVYSALAGRTQGVRGEAHQVAVALGLKAPPRGLTEALGASAYPPNAEGTVAVELSGGTS